MSRKDFIAGYMAAMNCKAANFGFIDLSDYMLGDLVYDDDTDAFFLGGFDEAYHDYIDKNMDVAVFVGRNNGDSTWGWRVFEWASEGWQQRTDVGSGSRFSDAIDAWLDFKRAAGY